MERMKREKRDYTKSDDKMLEQSQTMRNLFEGDKADFIVDFTRFADPFSDRWQADIVSARALPASDEQFDELEVKTEDVEALMGLARAQFQKMASYIRLIFPASKAEQGVFGLDKYVKVRKSQREMHDLMQLAYRMANSAGYKADLIAAGFVQAQIDMLNTLAHGLYDAYTGQEDFKNQIKLDTEERVAFYNKVWGLMKAVSGASKQVYVGDFAKQRQYLLYP